MQCATNQIRRLKPIAYWNNGTWCQYIDQADLFNLAPEFSSHPYNLAYVDKEWGAAEINQLVQHLTKQRVGATV
jgi:hypothetical protein